MTFEEVKLIRQNSTENDVDNKELSEMIDYAIDKQIEMETKDCFCPACTAAVFGEKFCPECGQKIKWLRK